MTGPDSILAALRRGELAGARTLRLSGLALGELPPEVLGLADTLELLDLGDNPLDALPAEFARLKRLRVLFCSNTRFARLPPVLGDCPALEQVGFRDTGLREVPAEALPSSLRWLTLTGNRIERLPESLGQRPLLQKLMLSGHRLQALPDGLEGAPALELLRLSANRFERLPCWLPELPRLAWLAWAGNPMDCRPPPSPATVIPWNQLSMGPVLGEGASGTVRRATWTGDGAAAGRPVAVKLFKNAMTSDGLPGHEMAACLQAGEHPHLVGTLGRLAGHPSGTEGLVMTLLPDDWRPLAAPPSLRSCSRDVYDPALRLRPDAVLRIARGVGAATAHLHRRGLLHGDLYAHNVLWDGTRGDARLSDLGAASILPAPMSPASTPTRTTAAALRRLDVLAWGVLLGELLQRCDPAPGLEPLLAVQRACTRPAPRSRPALAEALASLT